jgi:hypothetical protein
MSSAGPPAQSSEMLGNTRLQIPYSAHGLVVTLNIFKL